MLSSRMKAEVLSKCEGFLNSISSIVEESKKDQEEYALKQLIDGCVYDFLSSATNKKTGNDDQETAEYTRKLLQGRLTK